MVFQIGSTLLDACVLSVVRQADTYGYMLTQTLKSTLEISESTLYPVLRRLLKDGCLVTYDQPYMGRNRRYYRITERGVQTLSVYREAWKEYRDRIDGIITGGENSEQN